jgi:hypothetical protein
VHNARAGRSPRKQSDLFALDADLMSVLMNVLKGCLVESDFIILMMRVNQPEVIVNVPFLVDAAEHIEALSEALAEHLLFLSEETFLHPHSSFLSDSLAHVGVHVILLIKNCIHAVHLPEANHVRIYMIIMEMLIIYSCPLGIVMLID